MKLTCHMKKTTYEESEDMVISHGVNGKIQRIVHEETFTKRKLDGIDNYDLFPIKQFSSMLHWPPQVGRETSNQWVQVAPPSPKLSCTDVPMFKA